MRPTAKCSLLALAALFLAGGAARADWLLTRDGARVETKGPWKVDGRRVVFTQPDGTLAMLRTEEVDLGASPRRSSTLLGWRSYRPSVVATRRCRPRCASCSATCARSAQLSRRRLRGA